MVLTQHNVYAKWRINKIQFPYHYGSHATRPSLSDHALPCRFHTTMVLTQPLAHGHPLTRISLFPYHYGSHATDLK